MFLRRQDIIDRFDANFRTDANGQIFFHPSRAKYGAPISAEEYVEVMAAFEQRQAISMFITWLAFGAAGVYGMYQVIAFDDYAAFFVALAVAGAISFVLSSRDHTSLLRPFMERRDSLRTDAKQHSKSSVSSDNVR